MEIETYATPKTYQPNYLITDRNINPASSFFKKKGESYYLKNGDQWYFKPKGEEDFFRVKWFWLDSNVAEGSNGQAMYKGLNPEINGKVGELFYEDYQWYFVYDGEKYRINNPDSVTLL